MLAGVCYDPAVKATFTGPIYYEVAPTSVMVVIRSLTADEIVTFKAFLAQEEHHAIMMYVLLQCCTSVLCGY